MKKRFLALILGMTVLAAALLSGCGKDPGQQGKQPVGAGGALSVYVVESDALYVQAVKNFQKQAGADAVKITNFKSYQAMSDQMNVELMSKGGPDVVLYNGMQGEVDAWKLANSGMFLPLDGFVQQLDGETYPAALMNAGKLAGKQYFIPFSYNLICAFTTEAKLTERGYSVSDNVYDTLLAESDALLSSADRSPTTVNIFRPDPVNSFFDAAGVKCFDKDSGALLADKEELEAVCRFVKLVYDNTDKTVKLSNKYSNDFAGAADHFTFFTEDYAFLNNVRYYQSMFQESVGSPMAVMPYHKLNDPQSLCASIVCFGGVNANSKMPDKAFELLKYILDYPVTNNWSKYEASSVYSAPVSLAVYESAVEELASTKGMGPVTIEPLTEDNAALLRNIPGRITDAVIPNMTLGSSIQELFDPYFMGKDSFDNCYKALMDKLPLYLSE